MTLTLDNLPEEVQAALRRRAESGNTSVEAVAVEALEKAFAHIPHKIVARDLSHWQGLLPNDPAFRAAVAAQRRVEPELWR